MDYRRPGYVTVALTVLASTYLAASAPRPQGQAASALRPYLRASDAELRRLDRGDAITRTVSSNDPAEMTAVGAIRVRCSPSQFLERVRDVERFKASDYLLQIGRFSRTPSLDDVAGLEMEAEDREDLRACRPGKCALRLPAAEMIAMREAVPWGTPGEAEAANAALRRLLVNEATAYLAGGSGALADYADQQVPVRRGATFDALLRVSAYRAEYQPEVFAFLAAFPAADATGIDSALIWSRERFGLKPITNITHSVIRREGDVIVFASKMVYTNHYFDASMGMSVYVPAQGGEYAYVTYMNRSRVSALKGALGSVARVVAAGRSRDALARTLRDVRVKLER